MPTLGLPFYSGKSLPLCQYWDQFAMYSFHGFSVSLRFEQPSQHRHDFELTQVVVVKELVHLQGHVQQCEPIPIFLHDESEFSEVLDWQD